MSIAGNSGSKVAAEEILAFVRERLLLEDLGERARRELEAVEGKCKEIIRQCESGWY